MKKSFLSVSFYPGFWDKWDSPSKKAEMSFFCTILTPISRGHIQWSSEVVELLVLESQICQKWATRSSRPEVFCKKGLLRNFTKFIGKHLCQSVFFNKVAGACNFIKKETLAQVFSYEFFEISKNTFLHWTLLVAASGQHYFPTPLFKRSRFKLSPNPYIINIKIFGNIINMWMKRIFQ